MPGLDLLNILNNIPFEHHKTTTLTFEIRAKYRCVIPPDTATSVSTDSFVASQHPNWRLFVKNSEKVFLQGRNLQLVPGAVRADFTGPVEIIVRNLSPVSQSIPRGQILGKVVCTSFQY
jgi:dUTPase